jgi:c-di-GMP-binding flagellar brake protein YcgR
MRYIKAYKYQSVFVDRVFIILDVDFAETTNSNFEYLNGTLFETHHVVSSQMINFRINIYLMVLSIG